jgi:hypothetical protein
LSQGFKYLGYHLKPGATKSEDWCWLVEKFERKIGFWCNKWLSLGGRFVLVKTVLESLSIFWMSLERIPCNILAKLRKLSFNFLWSGQNEKHHIHLCSWDILSRPLRAGGWGLKNLPLFNTALLENSYGERLHMIAFGIESLLINIWGTCLFRLDSKVLSFPAASILFLEGSDKFTFCDPSLAEMEARFGL